MRHCVLPFHYLYHQLTLVLALKRGGASHHLIQQHSKTPDVY